MGVPKFYRWLSERYPCLSEVVKEHQIPEFDNLYLDMNGIIHNCSHPNDDDPHFRITEEKIFADIFHYIEVLFRMIQPKKVFFMAIDGVAPRAKMNQQRGRRFRSAKEAELSEKRARDRGEELPKEARFDSNCITPGTPFMCRLHDQLKYFVTKKISTDSLWQNVKVILSGHETPGEGEHKIMDFIRYEKAQAGYDPNIRHCLYGLDADLIMLGLCSHDPHFSLLREEVRFTGKKTAQKRTVTPENTTFHLLHLSLLREYIDHEFSPLRDMSAMTFPYDLECIIDDWILMGFLVGNDFLPHLPHLHINKGALSELFSTYKKVLPILGGYMNENGKLNLPRFEIFLQALAENEKDRFEDIYSDAKWIEGKTAKKIQGGKSKVVIDTPGPAQVEESFGIEDGWEIVSHNSGGNKKDDDLKRLLQSADDFLLDSPSEPTDHDESSDGQESLSRDDAYQIEFRQHKREYYIHKLGYDNVTPAVLKEQAEGYVLAIQWNLHYYYDGCVSWSWYYRHHYAPWITDIKGFADTKLVFDKGEPFLPFEQLMSVLPPASKDLLPPILQHMMVDPSSPILDFYPKDFMSDLNGKQQEWEAVVLIPFIDEKKLQATIRPLFDLLHPDEKARNVHGPMMAYKYGKESLGPYHAPLYFPTIERNLAHSREIWRAEWEVPDEDLQKGLMKGVKLDVYFPGFPTLKHIPHKAKLGKEGVKVFEQSSRGDNMMLHIKDQGNPDVHEVAQQLLGQEIWVAWPHMVEAMVDTVESVDRVFYLDKNGKMIEKDQDKDNFRKDAHVISEQHRSRYGILVGDTSVILSAKVICGRKYVCGKEGKITLEKIWSKTVQKFALQTTRKDILVHDPSFLQFRTLHELFPNDSTCFVLASTHYGCEATVKTIDKQHHGRIQLKVIEPTEPDLEDIRKKEKEVQAKYFPGFVAAKRLGISSHLLSRITGTMFVLKGPKEAELDHAGKVNIGLNLKNNKKGEEVCGFTKKNNENNWLYSTKALDALRNYMHEWPEVFNYLCTSERINGDYFYESDIFPDSEPTEKLKQLTDWIKEQPFFTASRQPCGTLTIDENIVKAIEEEVTNLTESEPPKKEVVMQLKPHLIFKPSLFKGSGAPDQEANYFLFDRVVNVREGFSVPLGLRGTVIGILKADRQEDSFIEVLFDKEFEGGQSIRTSSAKAYRVPRTALINLSHGVRLESGLQNPGPVTQKTNNKPMAVVPPIDQVKRTSYARQTSRQNSVGKEGSPMAAVKHVTPPDPRSLPMPTDFLSAPPSFSKGRGRGQRKEPQGPPQHPPQNQTFSMDALWQSLQQPQAGGGQFLPPVVDNSSSPALNPNVQQFFAQHQSMQPIEMPTEPPVTNMVLSGGVAPPSFVPLQVALKGSGRGRGQGRGQAQQPPQRHEGQTPFHRGGQRGRGRGRGDRQLTQPPQHGQQNKKPPSKAKLAANFPSSS